MQERLVERPGCVMWLQKSMLVSECTEAQAKQPQAAEKDDMVRALQVQRGTYVQLGKPSAHADKAALHSSSDGEKHLAVIEEHVSTVWALCLLRAPASKALRLQARWIPGSDATVIEAEPTALAHFRGRACARVTVPLLQSTKLAKGEI
eukprot:1147155-Pelagomonas_calceolata.AAC.8